MRVLLPGRQWIIFIFLLFGFVSISLGWEEKFCPYYIEIRNFPSYGYKPTAIKEGWDEIYKCTIVDGDFAIVMVKEGNETNSKFPVFQNLREITGSLLVYAVKTLTNLGEIFPNLRVIGGQSLIWNYALVIYQNENLKYLGLDKLKVIRNGGVRITENPKLCYARSIDWDSIMVGKIRDVMIDESGSSALITDGIQAIENCRDNNGCKVDNPEKCQKMGKILSCWNSTTCQEHCKYHKLSNGIVGPGCSLKGEKCHSSCLGGCDVPNDPGSCYSCQNYEFNGKCVDRCPPGLFEYKDSRCLTKALCDNLLPVKSTLMRTRIKWKAFHGKCHTDCPDGYQEDPKDPYNCVVCQEYCPKRCQGGIINSIGEAIKYSKCSIIEGKLEISIQGRTRAEKFSEAFGNIREITGYLSIRFCPTFTSLYMFKNLRIIHGEELSNDRYALSVMELENLRQLFSPEVQANIQIRNGSVSFQNNLKLCYNKISKFITSVGLEKNVTENDISKYSNGEKAVCEEVPLEVKVTYVSYFSFLLTWNKFDTTNMDQRKFMGYLVHYKKVDKIDRKMQVDDDRSVCGDSWKMVFLQDDKNDLTSNVSYSVERLDPNAIYAYYVQTKTVHHPGARNGISEIGFVRTNFSTPDRPRLKRAEAGGPDTIVLEWDPPIEANGVITHYTVVWSAKSIGPVDFDPCGSHHHSTSPSSMLSQKESSSQAKDTCEAKKGCCKCPDPPEPLEVTIDAAREEGESAEEEKNISKSRTLRSIIEVKPQAKPSEVGENNAIESFPKVSNENITHGRINISSSRLVITDLFHFTEYYIQIVACQDVTVPENYCSKQAAVRVVRTHPIPEKDVVDVDTIEVEPYVFNGTDNLDSRLIKWEIPSDPNGAILGFRYKIWRQNDQRPSERCIGKTEFEKNDGALVTGLGNGIYTLQIQTVSTAGKSESVFVKDLFTVYVPGWLTWDRALYILLGLIVLVGATVWLAYRHYKRNFGKKVQEYLSQTMSANPDYFTHLDVYQKDEWELNREDIKLYDEIGRGTFGKVYLGEGKSIVSKCGVKFGRCAVKTIPETSANAERLHFLIEASVMKQFNTAYIVKLYGVVSEGQPVLVVMEMMDQGNLRDYLRARRPNSEENTNNAPLPTMISYFKWAAQIADGMAYLESLKFCHRDLAARNCMVSNDETVKIGDFGMARDIYYHEYYKPAGKRLMPVRWMAPESLKDGKFTVKSDVWSYGIVLYEMLTLGQQPYAGLGNDQVYNYIEVRRNILVRPMGCPNFWYDLMRVCWKYNPRERPSFYQILLFLKETIDTSFKEFLDVREEGLKIFDRSFVINRPFLLPNFDEIEDQDYDFDYNEEEEDARKHKMLKDLDRMKAGGEDHHQSEFYKQQVIGGNDGEENEGGHDGNGNGNEDDDEERFRPLTVEDIPQQPDFVFENPPMLTSKQIKERNREREKFNKRQMKLEKEWQRSDAAEEAEKKYAETESFIDRQQKTPLIPPQDDQPPSSPSIQLSPGATRFLQSSKAPLIDGTNYTEVKPSTKN